MRRSNHGVPLCAGDNYRFRSGSRREGKSENAYLKCCRVPLGFSRRSFPVDRRRLTNTSFCLYSGTASSLPCHRIIFVTPPNILILLHYRVIPCTITSFAGASVIHPWIHGTLRFISTPNFVPENSQLLFDPLFMMRSLCKFDN